MRRHARRAPRRWPRRLFRRLLAPFVLVAAASTLAAQTSPAPVWPQAEFCFRGAPLEHCHNFMLFELETTSNVSPKLGGAHDQVRLGDWWSLGLGGMHNIDSLDAIGAILTVAPGDASTATRVAVTVRRRWWSRAQLSFDAEAGAVALSQPPPGRMGPSGFGVTGGAALNAWDLFAVTAHADVVAVDGGVRPLVSLGVRTGSYVSAAAVLATLLFAAGLSDGN